MSFRSGRSMTASLPPGPKGRLLNTVRFAHRPVERLKEWQARFGDPFTISAVNGNVVTTGRPELIKTILAHDPADYDPFAVEALLPITGPNSIFARSGTAHVRQRRLLMPPFHGERMRDYASLIDEVTLRRASSQNEPTTMLALAQKISLEVIVRAVFGAEQDDEVERIERAIGELNHALHPILLFIPQLQRRFGGLGPFARLKRSLRGLHALLQSRIETCRASGNARTDILSLLLNARDEHGEAMADEEIRSHLVTLLFAGHETTAISLSWAVDQVGRHSDVLHRLREESAFTDEQPFVRAVVKEVLRLFPPVTEVLRELRAPLVLDRWTLPIGAVVSPSIYLAHRNPACYPNPDSFRPERFLNATTKPETYLPFGGGHRRCIGAAFAQFELEIALSALVRAFDFDLLAEGPERLVRRNVTVAPASGVPVRLRPRPPQTGAGRAA